MINNFQQSGIYINELKLNYIQPALEYFSQNCMDEKSNNLTYLVITYTATQGLMPSVDSHGPFYAAREVLTSIDSMGFIGGKSDANACVSEGLATALVAFKDLEEMREHRVAKKFIILICNSPPYLLSVTDCSAYEGKNIEQLAVTIQENNINLSVISPRKLPIFLKIYEKSGGDMAATAKNYSKDTRHLVLLKGFTLSERAISPTNVNSTSVAIPPNQIVDNIVQQQTIPVQQSQPAIQIQQPQAPQSCGQEVMNPQMMNPMANPSNFRPLMPSQAQLGNNSQMSNNTQMVNPQMINPQMRPMMQQPLQAQQMMQQASSLQRQPGPQVRWPRQQQFVQQNQFANQQQGPQIMNQQQAQANSALRMQLMNPQNQQMQNQNPLQSVQMQNQNPLQSGMSQQGGIPQQGAIPQPGGMSQPGMQAQNPQQHGPGMQQTGIQQINSQQGPAQPGIQQGSAGPLTGANRMQGREKIWSGIIEWFEKPNKNDQTKIAKQAPFHVSANIKNGEPDIKAESWPPRLLMQLMPKQMVGSAGGPYLKESKTVVFHPSPCEALETLSKVMASGMAGCVHFNNSSEIKILILLYTAEKKAFLGFIPNDQVAFVDKLRKVITQSKQQQSLQQNNVQGQLQIQGQMPMQNQGQNMQQPNQMMQTIQPGQRMQMMQQEMVSVNIQPDQSQWQNQQQMMSNQQIGQGIITQNTMGQNLLQTNQMNQIGGGSMNPQQQQINPGLQRMVRPNMMPNNPGLRHLLQQQVLFYFFDSMLVLIQLLIFDLATTYENSTTNGSAAVNNYGSATNATKNI